MDGKRFRTKESGLASKYKFDPSPLSLACCLLLFDRKIYHIFLLIKKNCRLCRFLQVTTIKK